MRSGLVIKSTGSWYTVKVDSGTIQCKIKGKFRIKGVRTTNPIAVGDKVDFINVDNDDTGLINNIHKRKNYIIRKSINLSRQAHIIAANIDHAYLMVTMAFPETPTAFIDRFLVMAQAYRIPSSLIFNKVDLYDDKFMEYVDEIIEIYEKIGYKCYKVSAVEGTNVETIRDLLKGNISLIAGNSGVGKSTLINKLDSNLDLKTDKISAYHLKGKHTTTFAEMFELESGGFIIDTPGIKGFGMVDIDKEELYHFFPEIFEIAKDCQFNNCLHTHEPKCAVKKAVEEGEISDIRYYNYLTILESDENDKYRTVNY